MPPHMMHNRPPGPGGPPRGMPPGHMAHGGPPAGGPHPGAPTNSNQPPPDIKPIELWVETMAGKYCLFLSVVSCFMLVIYSQCDYLLVFKSAGFLVVSYAYLSI